MFILSALTSCAFIFLALEMLSDKDGGPIFARICPALPPKYARKDIKINPDITGIGVGLSLNDYSR